MASGGVAAGIFLLIITLSLARPHRTALTSPTLVAGHLHPSNRGKRSRHAASPFSALPVFAQKPSNGGTLAPPPTTTVPNTTAPPPTTDPDYLAPGATYAPLSTPVPAAVRNELPLEPWVIAILALAGLLICGGMVYAAKRAKRARDEKAAKPDVRRARKESEFERRIKKITG